MKDKNIRFAASIPSLDGKILTKIDGGSDSVFWYIKFNMPLDPASVNEKSMFVTDLGGYKMETIIEYSTEENLISIQPVDTYKQGTFYILTISTKVKSAKGNRLKRDIHIVFKLLNDEISDYTVLKDEVALPPTKKRPDNYDELIVTNKVYGLGSVIEEQVKSDQLKPLALKVNIFLPIGMLVLFIGGLFLNNMVISGVLAVALVISILYVIYQMRNNEVRAVYNYNNGVRAFNKGDYDKAEYLFKKAFNLDPYNEIIEYSNGKVKYYR